MDTLINRTEIPDTELDRHDYDVRDEVEALRAETFRSAVTGLPARPGTIR